jgi:glycosyltransferase involved in cell wall biosynthesis
MVIVIIPAFNEEQSLAQVLADIPKHLVSEIVVVNNASTDKTAQIAQENGATVLYEAQKGYGFACLKGIAYAKTKSPEIVVFLDGDYSDYPEEMADLLAPILSNKADFVLGSRLKGNLAKGAMPPQAYFGNVLAGFLMKLFYGANYSDLGPFRAIKFQKLCDLNMQDTTYGWTIEMQLKAHNKGYRILEIPVSYRKRIGVSKISGTVLGTLKASYKILGWIIRFGVKQ